MTCLKFGFPAPGRFEDTDRSEIDQLAGYFHYFGVKGHFLMHLDRLSKESGPA